MALSVSGLADALTAAQGVAQDAAIQTAENTKTATAIINYLIANTQVSVTIPPASINTAGSPSNQVGPPAPVQVSGTIS